MDENGDPNAAPGESGDKGEQSPAKSYPDDALPERQARITDLLPISIWAFVAGITFAALAITGVQFLYVFHQQALGTIGAESLAAFDLESSANLGTWLSSVTFFLSGCASLLIFSLRRHRHDDYRGRYRVWPFLAMLFLIASIDAASGLRGAIAGLAAHYSGLSSGHNLAGWTLLVCACIGGLAALRLCGEIFRSRAAVAGLLLTIAAYSLSAAVLGGFAPVAGLQLSALAKAITINAAAATGHAAALLTVLLYGRYVMLDTQGMVKPRVSREKKKRRWTFPKRSKTSKPKGDSDDVKNEKSATRIDRAHAKSAAPTKKAEKKTTRVDPPQSKQPAKSTPSGDSAKDSDVPSDHSEGEKKLTKAERRRRRKERRANSA